MGLFNRLNPIGVDHWYAVVGTKFFNNQFSALMIGWLGGRGWGVCHVTEWAFSARFSAQFWLEKRSENALKNSLFWGYFLSYFQAVFRLFLGLILAMKMVQKCPKRWGQGQPMVQSEPCRIGTTGSGEPV